MPENTSLVENGLIGTNGLIGESGLTNGFKSITINNSLKNDGLSGVSGYIQNSNNQVLQTNTASYKFMKVSREGLSVSDQPDQNTFAPVVQVKKSYIIFNQLFDIIIGNELLQHFIIRIMNTFLSKWFVLCDDGSVVIDRKSVV